MDIEETIKDGIENVGNFTLETITIKDTTGYYEVTSLAREDLESIGFDTSTLSDEDMYNIAKRLGDSYFDGNASFWGDLESIAIDIYGLKQQDM